jgi:hypothetical protein
MAAEEDELCCPITHERLRDPVTAEDNRVYEREAIVRWINENGTSPFTRQVLHINRLVPNERIKRLADQQRKLSVSYVSQDDHQVVVKDRFLFLRRLKCSRIDEYITNTCPWCCSPNRRPWVCLIIMLVIGVVGIISILTYSIVMGYAHGS